MQAVYAGHGKSFKMLEEKARRNEVRQRRQKTLREDGQVPGAGERARGRWGHMQLQRLKLLRNEQQGPRAGQAKKAGIPDL